MRQLSEGKGLNKVAWPLFLVPGLQKAFGSSLYVTFVILLMAVISGCGEAASNAGGEYTLINSGISAESPGPKVSWCDERHLVVALPLLAKRGVFEDTRLIYIDADRPSEKRIIDLSTLGDMVDNVACRQGEILFHVFDDWTKVYRARTVESVTPELLAELKGGGGKIEQMSEDRARYLVGGYRLNSSVGTVKDEQCSVRFIKAGYRVICWDLTSLVNYWPLQKFVLTEYQWRDTITVRGEDGQPKFIPNPADRLVGKNGKPLNYALFLRDLNNQILVNLSDDPIFAVVAVQGVAFSTDESYMYSVCGKRGQKFSDTPYVCRYPLDGKEHQWEEVFEFIPKGQKGASVESISLSTNGDIYFFVAGGRYPINGIWKFDARTKQIQHVTAPKEFVYDRSPKVSPDGKKVAFIRSNKNELFIAQVKGATP